MHPKLSLMSLTLFESTVRRPCMLCIKYDLMGSDYGCVVEELSNLSGSKQLRESFDIASRSCSL